MLGHRTSGRASATTRAKSTPVETRSFVADRDEVRHFLEISWTGPEVEPVSGVIGQKGRALKKVFRSVAERDTWIAGRIARAKKEGFLEAS